MGEKDVTAEDDMLGLRSEGGGALAEISVMGRRLMNKEEILKQMLNLIDMQERAIQEHPARTAAVYIGCRDAFIEGQSMAEENDWTRAMSLALHELSIMHRCMLSSSFISAWYHLAHDKTNRDKMAHSCCTLVSSLGLDPSGVMQKYIEYEQVWRQTMKTEGIAPRRFSVVAIVAVLAIIGLLLVVILSKHL